MDKWISVDERLPDKIIGGVGCSEGVIVTDGNKVWTSNWWGEIDQWNDEDEIVTHWQPLPKPPKVHTQEEINAWDSVE